MNSPCSPRHRGAASALEPSAEVSALGFASPEPTTDLSCAKVVPTDAAPRRTPRRRLAPSAIRRSRRQLTPYTLDLGLGEPTWEWPDDLHDTLAEALACSRRWGYGPHAGDTLLRQRIADYEGVSADEVLVTSGAQGALAALTQAFLGPGDEALVPDPGFPAYPALVRLAGAEPVPYALDGEAGFNLAVEPIVELLASRPAVRMLILNHPANPTGAGASTAVLRDVARACRQRGVLLVSDEVYRDLEVNPGCGFRSAVSDTEGVVVGSMSKAWAAPGLRVGWMVASPSLLEICRELHAWTVTSVSGPSQAMAAALLGLGDRLPAFGRRQLARRWRGVEEVWREELSETLPVAGRGLYLWAPLPVAGWDDPWSFCADVQQRAGVAVVPGLAFGERGRRHVRLALGGATETVVEGVRRWIRAGGVGR